MKKLLSFLLMSSVVLVMSSTASVSSLDNESEWLCCPDVTSITVSPSSVCTGDVNSFEADVDDLTSGLECSELEQDGFTWEWTCLSGCNVVSVSDDEADINVTAAVGTNIQIRVKATGNSSCTPPLKSKRFVIPVTSTCGS